MRKIGFLFAGQGSQYPGMGKEIALNIKESSDIFKEANKALGFDIQKLCFDGTKEELEKTENTQPAVFTVGAAIYKALLHYGIVPYIEAGLSLGEYTALYSSGCIDFSDAVKLVRSRGKIMQDAVPQGIGAMAAIIGLKSEKVLEICKEAGKKGIVEAANLNCPGQVVISGESEAVKLACQMAVNEGAIKAVKLLVSGPFHSSMMADASLKLEKILKDIDFREMQIPVITNVTGERIKSSSDIKGLLIKQIKSPVYFEKSIRNMIDEGVNVFVEIGPGNSLSKFVKRIDRSKKIYSVQDMETLLETVNALSKN